MKIVSFNVNSVRLRIHQLEAVISKLEPDVIGLQETKCNDPDFPDQVIRDLGYEVFFHGQKTHYGVAMMTRLPYDNIIKGFPGDTDDAQKRMIGADVKTSDGNTVRILNGYFPQGENRSHAVKFPAKNKFYQDTLALLTERYDAAENVMLIGDFNIAPVEKDNGIGPDNAKRWLREGKSSFLPEEREWLGQLMRWGLKDTFREKYPETDNLFSWFDYRSKGFDRQPKRGMRIDHLLASKTMTSKLVDSGVCYEIRAMQKPSDHCPVWSEFDI